MTCPRCNDTGVILSTGDRIDQADQSILTDLVEGIVYERPCPLCATPEFSLPRSLATPEMIVRELPGVVAYLTIAWLDTPGPRRIEIGKPLSSSAPAVAWTLGLLQEDPGARREPFTAVFQLTDFGRQVCATAQQAEGEFA